MSTNVGYFNLLVAFTAFHQSSFIEYNVVCQFTNVNDPKIYCSCLYKLCHGGKVH
jgi:hypothetical protein